MLLARVGSAWQVTKPEHIIATDIYKPSLERIAASGVRTSDVNIEVSVGGDRWSSRTVVAAMVSCTGIVSSSDDGSRSSN